MHTKRFGFLWLVLVSGGCSEAKTSSAPGPDSGADARGLVDATDDDSGGGGECRLVGDGCSGRSPDCCPIYGSPVVVVSGESCVAFADRTVIGCAAVACRGGNAAIGCYEITDAQGDVTVYITGSTWDDELLSASVAMCADGEYGNVAQCE